jgi:citrate lyase beta subunit
MDLREKIRRANWEFAQRYPGESGARQPVHTVYGGAHLFKADTAKKMGEVALHTLKRFAPAPKALAAAVGSKAAAAVYRRVVEKLRREPVEDFRLDFEDGYGNRPDAEEDGHAVSAAKEVAAGLAAGTLPPFIGIRIKPFTEELRERSLRTLELFLTALKTPPPNFVVTYPKPTMPVQVEVLADLLERHERSLDLAPGSLRLELMIETPQSILLLRELLAAARGRCAAAHFGTYDYTASMGITASHQRMDHPACDFARQMMKVAYAGTGIWLSDGATNILPVGKDRKTVHRAWKLHYQHIRNSLVNGYYQGWDLHPAQLPTRYAAVYAFFLESLELAGERLKNFVEKAARATLIGDVFDDAATGQGLLNYFLRAVNCGAVTEEEAQSRTGLTHDELRSGSFVKILNSRR